MAGDAFDAQGAAALMAETSALMAAGGAKQEISKVLKTMGPEVADSQTSGAEVADSQTWAAGDVVADSRTTRAVVADSQTTAAGMCWMVQQRLR